MRFKIRDLSIPYDNVIIFQVVEVETNTVVWEGTDAKAKANANKVWKHLTELDKTWGVVFRVSECG